MVWFGLLIFMGLVKTEAKNSRVDMYRQTNGQVSFAPLKNLSVGRFQQLK